MPFFICQATYRQCIANNVNDDAGQAQCQENEQCGSRNATVETQAHSVAQTSTTPSDTQTSALSATSSDSTRSSASSLVLSSTVGVATTTPSPDSQDSSSSISTGAAAGIGVGATIVVVILTIILFWFWRKRRHQANNKAQTQPPLNTNNDTIEKPELFGDLGKTSSYSTAATGDGPWPKSELITNANRHELGPVRGSSVQRKPISTSTPGTNHTGGEIMTASNRHEVEDTGMSATLSRPWSIDGRAELPEHQYYDKT